MFGKFQTRFGAAAEWDALNPVLDRGEPGYVIPNGGGSPSGLKIGDGVTPWSELPFISSGGASDAEVATYVEQVGSNSHLAVDVAVADHVENPASSIRQALTRTGNLPVGRDELFVAARDHGAVGDGASDDLAALNTAATAAAAAGVPLRLEPGATYFVTSSLTLPEGISVDFMGATIQGPNSMDSAVLRISEDSHLRGVVDVRCGNSITCRGVAVIGSRVRVDALRIAAPTPGTGAGSNLRVGLSIADVTDVVVGSVHLTNWDYPIRIAQAERVHLCQVYAQTYVRGILIQDGRDVTISSGHLSGASPNSLVTAGHNGLLISSETATDSCRNVRVADFTIEDAGEHAVRISGTFRTTRVWLDNCVARNSGASGFKILGSARNADIFLADCVAIDSGQDSNNQCGFLIQSSDRVFVTNAVVAMEAKTGSAYAGIRINNGNEITITNPLISDTINGCYRVDNELGDSTDVVLRGGKMTSTRGDGIVIQLNTRTYRRVNILGHPVVSIGGTGYSIVVTGPGTLTGGSAIMEVQSPTNAARHASGDLLNGYTVDFIGNMPGSNPPDFRNGSLWTDYTNGARYLRKAGAWNAL